jgi:4-amino-4-deoxy-L-arabinose transferase-like glycosyltransferase
MEMTGGIGGGEHAGQTARSAGRKGIGARPAAALVFALSLAMHLPFLGMTPMAGTEGHRILPAHEMVRSGWWAVPMLFGKPFMTKPPLHLWLIAISEVIAAHGNVFVWRLPSAIAGALLCAAACLFGARWFGRTAGLISGVCCVGLITLWGQSQVADIDATNTLAAAVCALCEIELLIVQPRNAWPWVLGAGLSLGATLLTKGPGGLPIILGVWLWGGCILIARRQRFTLLRDILVPLLIGGAIFGVYVWFARQSLARHHVVPDLSGVQEGASRLYATSLGILAKTLLTIPTQLLAFGIPVSLALPVYLSRRLREQIPPAARPVATAIVGSVLIALAICVLSGMDNPRYGYPVLIPLCPLAGALAVAASRTVDGAKPLRAVASGTAIAYVLVAAALSVSAWRISHSRTLLPILIGSTSFALIATVWMLPRLARSWNAAWAFVPLIWLISVPFGIQRSVDRSNTSGFHAAADLRRIVGPAGSIAAGNAVLSKPEIFYYANLPVEFYSDHKTFVPGRIAPGQWVVLDTLERKRWLGEPGVHLEHEQWLCRNASTDYYVAWYGEK